MLNMNLNVLGLMALASFMLAGSFVLAAIAMTRLRSVSTRATEANACAYAAACVQAEREEFGSYNDRGLSDAENFEFYKTIYLESHLEMEGAN